MKINMHTPYKGSVDGVNLIMYGPGEVDLPDSLAKAFILIGVATEITGTHPDEMDQPKPVEIASTTHHPRKYTKRRI